jgi:hypothetical protein
MPTFQELIYLSARRAAQYLKKLCLLRPTWQELIYQSPIFLNRIFQAQFSMERNARKLGFCEPISHILRCAIVTAQTQNSYITEFRRDAIFDVLNAAHECKGQIVLNSNLSWTDFEQTFGTAFSWRVAQACYVVDLSAGSVTPPKVRYKSSPV